uniref:DC1 domain-containing protein n=1 Tax=Lactuca sativa TaxID=4236 RepID=A0A9R1WEU0_LACSA|nr:hypothetical protein LSAT_V11C200081490 [Lactuca sativa]
MISMKVREHSHPLKLIDLQLQYEEEEDEEEDEGVGFGGVTCWTCNEEIHMYHMYYYKCIMAIGDSSSSSSSSCNYFSHHKFCGELPSRLEHPSHSSHTLHLLRFPYSLVDSYRWVCNFCKRNNKPGELLYQCVICDFHIDIKCVVEVQKNVIHHPCHPHSLMCTITEPILCSCKACGKRHEGIFFQCTICTNFTIHNECAFLPEKLFIQERTPNHSIYHIHRLTISYSFPLKDQKGKHFPRCRVFGGDFVGFGKTIKNYEDIDHPGLLHLPFPDEAYSLPKHYLFFQQTTTDHHHHHHHQIKSHQHPLILVNQGQTSSSSSSNSLLLIKCHDPMKKTQLLCNGCLRPFMSTMRFYKFPQHSCSNFALHEWCNRLPPKIQNHPPHPQHTLLLIYSNDLPFFFGVCDLAWNGFAYGCVECGYYVDVTCGFIPKQITHKAHPNHLLSLV